MAHNLPNSPILPYKNFPVYGMWPGRPAWESADKIWLLFRLKFHNLLFKDEIIFTGTANTGLATIHGKIFAGKNFGRPYR